MRGVEVRLDMGGEVRTVGTLVRPGPLTLFEYDPSFLSSSLELSPFHLPLRAGVFEAPPDPYAGIHGLFNDSLPDGWGLLLMDRAFRKRGISRERISVLDRLSFIGTRGMGALTYHPMTGPSDEHGPLDLAELAAQSERLLEGSSEDVLPQLLQAGGSPAGARPKVLVGYRERDGAMISGSDTLPEGFRAYLVKFGARGDPGDAGPIEYAYARMAAASGIGVPPVRLFETEDGRRYFGAERFDRPDGERRHVHTLAGLLHADHRLPTLDYEGYLRTAWALTRDHEAVKEAFRRMVFNVLAHNRDDHTKNFAFVMEPGGNWRHTPAYDLTFSDGPGGEHSMAVAGEGRNPGRREFDDIAARMKIAPGDVSEIIGQVGDAVGGWPRFAAEAGVTRAQTTGIGERLARVREATGAVTRPASPSHRKGKRGRGGT